MFVFIFNFFRKKYIMYVDSPSAGRYEVRFRWLNQYTRNKLLRDHIYLDKLVRVSFLTKKETVIHKYPAHYRYKRDNYQRYEYKKEIW